MQILDSAGNMKTWAFVIWVFRQPDCGEKNSMQGELLLGMDSRLVKTYDCIFLIIILNTTVVAYWWIFIVTLESSGYWGNIVSRLLSLLRGRKNNEMCYPDVSPYVTVTNIGHPRLCVFGFKNLFLENRFTKNSQSGDED